MGKLDTVEVNGPEGDVVDWDAVDGRRVEDDVRRLRQRIFTEGLLEPGASKRRTPGSEGAAAQQCAAATRYWAVDVLQACGARVHLAHPLGVKGFRYRRVKKTSVTPAIWRTCCG